MKKILVIIIGVICFLLFTILANHKKSSMFNFEIFARGSMEVEILNAHNEYRKKLKLPPLKWSNKLSSHAEGWARHLAKLGGKLVHSSNKSRPGEGENLWMGTKGYYSYTQMVDSWGSEKKYFKYAKFPKVSKSGNWADVGHYTQMIWRDTKEVGCAISRARNWEILVCRYSPPGNYMGQKVY